MTSQRAHGLILAVGVAGLLVLSASSANAAANTQRALLHAQTDIVSWEGPESSEAECQAIAAAEKTEPNVLAAVCTYCTDQPVTGVYKPGWYNEEITKLVIQP